MLKRHSNKVLKLTSNLHTVATQNQSDNQRDTVIYLEDLSSSLLSEVLLNIENDKQVEAQNLLTSPASLPSSSTKSPAVFSPFSYPSKAAAFPPTVDYKNFSSPASISTPLEMSSIFAPPVNYEHRISLKEARLKINEYVD